MHCFRASDSKLFSRLVSEVESHGHTFRFLESQEGVI